MPSPQALVAFSLCLFLSLVLLRAHAGLGPNVAAAIAFVVSLGIAMVVERLIPPEVDEDVLDEEAQATAEDETRSAP